MENQNPLTDTTLTIKIPQIEPDTTTDELLRYFDTYQSNHYVLNVETYLSLLATEQAYKLPKDRKTFLDNTTSYISSLSNDRIAVYKREASYGNIEIFISVRGTRPNDIRDLNDDIAVVNGNVRTSPFTISYVQNIINIRKQFDNIDDDQIYIGGHSLGAISSLLASYILKVNGFGFNGAQSIVDLNISGVDVLGQNYDLNGIYNYDKYENYILRGDPIAFTSRFRLQNTIIIDVEKLSLMNPFQLHSINTMVDVTIPYISLNQESVARARRFVNEEMSDIEPLPTAQDALQSQRTTIDNGSLFRDFRQYLVNLPNFNLF